MCGYVILKSYLPESGNRKGVFNVEFLISLIVAVMAGVISHLICKWLDSDKK